MSRQLAFAGIDVAFAKGKKLPVCIVTKEGNRLVPIALREDQTMSIPTGKGNPALLDPDIVHRFGQDVLKYLQTIERDYNLQIATVAIDAPREYKVSDRRACERAMDQQGISCFATPSRAEFEKIKDKAKQHLAEGLPIPRLPHANQLWMLAGFEIFTALEHHYSCLEVFPQATVRALGAASIHKTKKDGLNIQLSHVAAHTGWRDTTLKQILSRSVNGALHDQLDAYMCAWVASLYPENCIPCGTPPKDVIWIPKVDSSRIIEQPPIELDPVVVDNKEVIQPAKQPVFIATNTPASGEFRNGTSRTTQIGFINRNDQECMGTRGEKGNDHNATAYKLACRKQHCGHVYGANGTDIHIRKCPECQNGAPGIAY